MHSCPQSAFTKALIVLKSPSKSLNLLKRTPLDLLRLPISRVRYCLTQHPDVEAKVISELAVAGVPLGDLEGCSRLLLEERGRSMLQQLPYLTAVLQEAMRMYPAGVAAAPR
jgi:hypothetical protein